MRNWITKNAEANRGIDVARDLGPLLKIGQGVTLGGLHVFYVISNGVRDLAEAHGTFLVFRVIQSS
jgi:hypothetical protein